MAQPLVKQVWKSHELDVPSSQSKAKRDARLSLQITRPMSTSSPDTKWSPASSSTSVSTQHVPPRSTAHSTPHPLSRSASHMLTTSFSSSGTITSNHLPSTHRVHVHSASLEDTHQVSFQQSRPISMAQLKQEVVDRTREGSVIPAQIDSPYDVVVAYKESSDNSVDIQSSMGEVNHTQSESQGKGMDLQHKLNITQAELKSSTQELKNTQFELNISQQELESSQQLLQSTQLELKATQQNLSNYKLRLDDLQKTLGTAREAVILTKNESNMNDRQQKATKHELAELLLQHEGALKALEISQQSLQTSMEQKEVIEQKYNTLQILFERTIQDLQTVQHRLHTSEQKREALQNNFNASQQQFTSANDDVKLLSGERGSLLLLLQCANQRTSEVQKNLEAAQQQIAILTSENTTLFNATQNVQKNFNAVQKQWDEARLVASNLTTHNSTLTSQFERLYVDTLDINKCMQHQKEISLYSVLGDAQQFNTHVSGVSAPDIIGAVCLASNPSDNLFVWDGNSTPCGGIGCNGTLFNINLLWEFTQYQKIIFVILNKTKTPKSGSLEFFGNTTKGRYLFSTSQLITALVEIYLDNNTWKLKLPHDNSFQDTTQCEQWFKATHGCDLAPSFYTAFHQKRMSAKLHSPCDTPSSLSSQPNSPQLNSPQLNSPQLNSPQLNSPQPSSPQPSSPQSNFVRYTKNPRNASDGGSPSLGQSRMSRQFPKQDLSLKQL